MGSVRRATGRLAAAEFDKAAGRLRLAERNAAAARAVLVDGGRTGDVAEALGLKRQIVSASVRRVYDSYLVSRSLPADWETVTVTVPPAVAEQVRAIASEARDKNLLRDVDDAAVRSQ